MKTKYNFTFAKSRFLNNDGSALIFAMGLAAIVTIGVAASIYVSENMMKSAGIHKDEIERDQLASSILTALSDQRVCSEMFPDGFNTQPGHYDFATNGSPMVMSKMAEFNERFSGYRPGIAYLTKEVGLKSDSNGVSYKQFDLSISVVSKSEGNGKIARVFGAGTAHAASNLKLVLGSNGRCYLDNYNEAESDLYGTNANCVALGGVYEQGRCHVKNYDMPYDGYVDFSKVENNEMVFADALCEMELAALRRLGPHLMKQSGVVNKAYGWTSLCAKPRWSGCRGRTDTNIDTLLADGNDPSSTNFILPGEEWSAKKTIKVKQFEKYLSEWTEPTIVRRANRAARQLASEAEKNAPAGVKLKDWVNYYIGSIKNTMKALGGGVAAGLSVGALTAAMSIAVTMSWAGPIGIAAGIILSAFAPKCDKLLATVNFQCTEGFAEIASVHYQTQKLKIKLSGFKCKWRDPKKIEIPSDKDMYQKVIAGGEVDFGQGVELESDVIAMDDATEIIQKLQNPNLTFDELLDMFDDDDLDPDEEVAEYGIPDSLMDAVVAAEFSMWAKFYATVNTEVPGILAPPRLKEVDELDSSYQNQVDGHYSAKFDQLSALAAQAKKYIAFSESIRNEDGTPRNLMSTTVYSTYIKPVIDRINAAGDDLASEASSRGVTLTPVRI